MYESDTHKFYKAQIKENKHNTSQWFHVKLIFV